MRVQVERVARAILKAEFYDCEPGMYESLDAFFAEVWDEHKDEAEHKAHAAIAAMQEAAQ